MARNFLDEVNLDDPVSMPETKKITGRKIKIRTGNFFTILAWCLILLKEKGFVSWGESLHKLQDSVQKRLTIYREGEERFSSGSEESFVSNGGHTLIKKYSVESYAIFLFSSSSF